MICSRRFKWSGFTLIELLIVVAIIAILAAIAVPNFLEAQVRSKVSRAKSDMRTMSTAMEAYFVDNNTYCNLNTAGQCPWEPNEQEPPEDRIWFGWKELTTPVAFITSIPADSFGDNRSAGATGRLRPPVYEIGAGRAGDRMAGSNRTNGFVGASKRDTWMSGSVGPDKWDNTISNVGTGGYPWGPATTNIAADAPLTTTYGSNAAMGGAGTLAGMIYDPTNGTISNGDILRFGGMKPTGSFFDYLYAGSAK